MIMIKGNTSNITGICNEVGQTIKREPSACKISGQIPVCETGTGRPSASESSQDAVVGVSNYQGSRPANSAITNTYHHVGDKCIQVSSSTADSSYPQVGSIDSRTMTVNSNYHNVTGNGRPVTSAVEYHHSGNANVRVAVSVNSVYHNSSSGNTNNNITSSYQHNNTSGSSGGGSGGTNVATSGPSHVPSNYQESGGGGGGGAISSSYHIPGSGVVPSNGGAMGQVNAPPGYYYTPILNSQQTLLRPIMAAQPPLYSPLLTPQQHSYPMPHPSPSTGSSYFTTLTESMRGTLSDIIPGTSDNSYKDTGQSGRQGTGLGQGGKTCDLPDPRHYAMEVCQRRLQPEGSYNSSSYPPCAGEVTRSHEQRSFDDYARMSSYGEDGCGRNWDGMGGCGTGTSGRSAAPPNHMAHPYTYSYTDCRLDVTWNKCVPGMSVGTMGGSSVSGENFHSQDNQIDTLQIKSSPRCSSHTIPVNMNMGVTTGDSSVSRSHYDYGSQIPPLFPYLTPLNYQQAPENRLEVRSDQRANTNRSNTQVCENQVSQSSTRQLELVHQSSDVKLANVPSSAQASTTSYSHTSTQHNVGTSSSSVSVNSQECLQQQKTIPSHHVQQCGHTNYKKETTDDESTSKCQSSELGTVTEKRQISETGAVAVGPVPSVPCSVVSVESTKQGTPSQKKEQSSSSSSSSVSGSNANCLICDTSVTSNDNVQENSSNVEANATVASCSLDTSITVMSKVSIGEKLGAVLGIILPRDFLHSTTICGKCFHLINELDVMEHRLAHYRKYIITKVETTSEKYGTRLATYRKLQQQHQQQQHFHQQQQLLHQQQQHQQHHQQHQEQQQLQQQQQHMVLHYQNPQANQQHMHQTVHLEQHNQQQSLHQLQAQQQQHLNSLEHQHHLHQNTGQQAVNQMHSHQIYLSHQQHQHQQNQIAYQQQHHKAQPIQEVVAQNVQQQDVITHVAQQDVTQNATPQEAATQNVTHPEKPTQSSVSKPSTNDTTGNNIGFGDCDIDIEDCDCNLINESQVPSKEVPSKEGMQSSDGLKKTESEVSGSSNTCSRANSEYVDINSVNSEPQPNEKSSQGCNQVCVEDTHLQKNESEVMDNSPSVEEETKEVLSTNSPVGPTYVVEDECRKIEDATEYHKPTLLTKNIKAKKHAKLQICRQCDQVFSNRQALVRHIERRHKAHAFHFSCDTCHKKFNSERALTRHVQLHKTYQCKLCDNIFFRKAKLKKHLENHAQESLSCKTCSKECGSLQALISHMKGHTQKKVFKCEICSKILANNRNLKEHMRVHTGEKPFGCDNCGRRFSHRGNMQAHHDTCTGHVQYKCQVCGKGFALESVYQRHLGEHKGQFAYCCSVCGKGFSKASGLQAHLPIHSTQRQTYSCQVCSQTFTSRSGYKSHTASHSGEDGYVCPVCGKTVIRRSDLKDHLNRHAGNKTHTCPVCDTAFYYRANMNHHVRTVHRLLSPYTCKICDKPFSSSYNYKSHIRIHTGEKPHQCKSCGKTFSSKGNYNRHLKCHVTQGMAPLSAEAE